MQYRSWITVFFPTPLIFRYHLPLKDLQIRALYTVQYITTEIAVKYRQSALHMYSV